MRAILPGASTPWDSGPGEEGQGAWRGGPGGPVAGGRLGDAPAPASGILGEWMLLN